VAAHFDEVYGAKVSRDTISRITDKVLEDMAEWQNRPLDAVYPVLFIDAIHVGGEGAKYWLQVLTEVKDRVVADVCIVVCDGLKALPESITTVWPQALVQACVLHLIRNTFRHASRKYWEQIARDLRPVYTAPTEQAAAARFEEFTATRGGQYPAIIALWRAVWSEFVPFLDYDVEIRRVICSTNAIESINAHYRRAVKARGHFPTEQAALKCLYLVTRSLDPTGKGRARWAMRWKPALNAFAITFAGRIIPTNGN
jgi:transposase-like protein